MQFKRYGKRLRYKTILLILFSTPLRSLICGLFLAGRQTDGYIFIFYLSTEHRYGNSRKVLLHRKSNVIIVINAPLLLVYLLFSRTLFGCKTGLVLIIGKKVSYLPTSFVWSNISQHKTIWYVLVYFTVSFLTFYSVPFIEVWINWILKRKFDEPYQLLWRLTLQPILTPGIRI